MLGLTIGIMVTALTIAGFHLKSQILTFVSAGFWIVFAVYMRVESLAEWDVHYALFFLGAGMTAVMGILGGTMWNKERKEKEEEEYEESPSIEEMFDDDDEDERETRKQKKATVFSVHKHRNISKSEKQRRRDDKEYRKTLKGE